IRLSSSADFGLTLVPRRIRRKYRSSTSVAGGRGGSAFKVPPPESGLILILPIAERLNAAHRSGPRWTDGRRDARGAPAAGRGTGRIVQRALGPSRAAAAAAGPGPGSAAIEDAPTGPPQGVPPAGDRDAAVDPDPVGDPRPVPPGGAAPTTVPRAAARGAPRHACPDVLQVRVLLAAGEAQGEHRARPGVVRGRGGIRARDDGDRGGAGGHRPRVRRGPRRAEDDRVLGPRRPRLEGGPAESDAPVRRGGARGPEPEGEEGPRAPEKGQEAPRVARHRGERGAGGRARGREGGVLPRVSAEPRAAPPA